MKKLLTCVGFISLLSTAMAQKEKTYEKIYYLDSKTETSDLIIIIDNAVSTVAETKLKLKIKNKTSDFIIFKPEESKFIINGKEFQPKEKWLVISPNESDFRVVNLKGAQYNSVKNYSFVVDGLYKASTDAKGIPVEDFKLPASKNDFKAGGFNCSLKKLYKETDATDAKFDCAYNGDKIGFIFPSKVSLKLPDGNEYANAKSKASPIVLMKGQEDGFTLHWDRMQGGKVTDMQKVVMMIKWNDTFSESALEKMKAETIEIQFDEVRSDKGNK